MNGLAAGPRWRHLRRDSLWWAGLSLIFPGSMLLLLVGMTGQEDEDYQTKGVPAVATVTSKDQRPDVVHNVITTKYILWYTYEAAGRSHWIMDAEVPWDRWEGAKIGDALRIEYLRDDPAKSRLAERADVVSREWWLWATVVAGVVLILTGLSIGIYTFLRAGRPVRATN
jgi:hypothetical protein